MDGSPSGLAVDAVLLFKASGDAAPLYLSADDPDSLKQVFHSGQPWLVWCEDSTDGVDLSPTHSIVEQAAPLLKGIAHVGRLDCSAMLPSGKSTYDKLGLNSTASPTMFFVGNGQKPWQVKTSHAKNVKALVQYTTNKATPVLRRPTSTEMLQQNCLAARWCALVLTDGKLSEPHKSDVEDLMAHFRNVQFNAIDASKYRLSTTPKMLRKGEPASDEPSMILIHRSKSSTKSTMRARVHRGDVMASGGAGDALEEALELKENGRPGGKGWVALTASPTISYRRGASRDSGSAREPEMSLWEEADTVAAELKAKRKAKQEESEVRKQQREQAKDDTDSTSAEDRCV